MGCGVKIAPGPPEARIDGAPENLDALPGEARPGRAFYFQLGGFTELVGRQQLYSRPLSLTNRGPYALREEVGI